MRYFDGNYYPGQTEPPIMSEPPEIRMARLCRRRAWFERQIEMVRGEIRQLAKEHPRMFSSGEEE